MRETLRSLRSPRVPRLPHRTPPRRLGSILLGGLIVLATWSCKKNESDAAEGGESAASKHEAISTPQEASNKGGATHKGSKAKASADKGKTSGKTTDKTDTSGEAATTAKTDGSVVRLNTTYGKIDIKLHREKAPKSTENFLRYVKDEHYDGTIFHRVIKGFMIQGGGFNPSYAKKPTRDPIENEADNGLKNKRGTVAMARTGDPHSASAQFFINVVDNPFLDHKGKTTRGWGYAVFGKVIDGMDVVDKIRAVKTGPKGPFPKDAPLKDVVIKSAKVLR